MFAGPACAHCFWIGAFAGCMGVWCQKDASQTTLKAGNGLPARPCTQHAPGSGKDRTQMMMTSWPLDVV